MNVVNLQSVILGILAVLLGVNGRGSSVNLQLSSNTVQPPPAATVAASSSNISRNWSGYEASGANYTGVGATWTVPNLSNRNNPNGADAVWVGIGGVKGNDLIQAGTQGTRNHNGQITYEAFYEGLPDVAQPLGIQVKGGDLVSGSLSQTSPGQWHISFKDNTSGQSTSKNLAYHSSLSSADWVVEAPSGIRRIMPLDNFGTVPFSNAFAIKNGQKISLSQTGAQAISMGSFGQLLASVSGIGSNGTSFTVSRTNSPAAVNQDPETVIFIRPGYLRNPYRGGFRRFDDD